MNSRQIVPHKIRIIEHIPQQRYAARRPRFKSRFIHCVIIFLFDNCYYSIFLREGFAYLRKEGGSHDRTALLIRQPGSCLSGC